MIRGFFFASLLMLTACQKQDEASAAVDAAQHDAFWLWAGVRPQAVLDEAKIVYILDSEYRGAGERRLIPLRPAIPQIRDADIWMVVRVETLDWEEGTLDTLLQRLARWEAANRLVGLQVDFDAHTEGLSGYAEFLRELRAQLPDRLKLSITGLLDWSANGDPQGLKALAGSVDEIVLQTYQGRKTIPGYQDYLAKLDRLEMPFRIGLVQGGEWREPSSLPAHPKFQGYVVFLLNPE